MSSSSCFPITEENLVEYAETANNFLKKVTWKPGKHLEKGTGEGSKPTRKWTTAAPQTTPEDSLSLIEIARAITKDEVLLPEGTNLLLRTVRTGIQLGSYLAAKYRISSGLKELDEMNKAKIAFTPEQRTDFNSKINTMSAVAIYTAASYIVWKLGSYQAEKVSSTAVEFNGIPEITLQGSTAAMKCMLYWFGSAISIERSGFAGDELAMIAVALKFFSGILSEVKQREASFKYTNFFTEVSYKLADSDFGVSGFNPQSSVIAVSREFNKVEWRQIVGNKIAKHEARKIVKMILLYCAKRKMNPIMVLGGLQSIRMGYGKPGTGKSMIIAAIATMFEKYCAMRGIPFLFWPFPDNMISTFQGGTAERAIEWWKRLADLDKIIYAAIDDAENNFEERTRQGVSAGVRENIGVGLRYTEGAYAINRGNFLVDVYTNIPEQVDKAFLSRVQSRFPIDGAETVEDFMDQDHLWVEKYELADPTFINMKNPVDYTYFDSQKAAKSVSAFESEATEPKDERIALAFNGLLARGVNPDEHRFFGLLYEEIHQKIYTGFTSRDVRNIQQAISSRIMDFEVPEVWFEDMNIYFEQEYEVKEELVKDLMKGNMKGLSFADIRLRESVKYLDNLSTISNIDRERKITSLVEDREIRDVAEERYAKIVESNRIQEEAAKKHALDNSR